MKASISAAGMLRPFDEFDAANRDPRAPSPSSRVWVDALDPQSDPSDSERYSPRLSHVVPVAPKYGANAARCASARSRLPTSLTPRQTAIGAAAFATRLDSPRAAAWSCTH